MDEERFYNSNTGELNDKEIINALNQAVEDYGNGEIYDVWDTCQVIANAIHSFCEREERDQ